MTSFCRCLHFIATVGLKTGVDCLPWNISYSPLVHQPITSSSKSRSCLLKLDMDLFGWTKQTRCKEFWSERKKAKARKNKPARYCLKHLPETSSHSLTNDSQDCVYNGLQGWVAALPKRFGQLMGHTKMKRFCGKKNSQEKLELSLRHLEPTCISMRLSVNLMSCLAISTDGPFCQTVLYYDTYDQIFLATG